MALYKRGPVWWMSFSYKGRQVRRSTEVTDRKLAEKIYHKTMTEIVEGKWLNRLPGASKTFREMMERYMAEHAIPKKASWKRDEFSLKNLLPFFGDCKIAEITPPLINEYKSVRRRRKSSPASINRELTLMKHAFNLAYKEWEWVEDNPVVKVSMEKEPPPRDRWLNYEEEKVLLAASADWIKPFVIFALETGCRKGEMLALQWKDVDLFGKVVNIFGSKTGDRRTIPLTEKALDALKEKQRERLQVRSIQGDWVFAYPPGQKVNVHALREAFEKALRKAAIENFRWHDLRHTFASRLAQSGVDPYTVQKLMGHKTFSTTQRYAHHHVESLRRGIGSLEAFREARQREAEKKLSQFYHSETNRGGA